MAAPPAAQVRLSPDSALAAARPLAQGRLVGLTWPAGPGAKWKISFARPGGAAEVIVDDPTAEPVPLGPPRPETTARLMRRIHGGTGMGALWQTIIFIGGLIPALLGVTGVMMWLRARRGRAPEGRSGVGREAAEA